MASEGSVTFSDMGNNGDTFLQTLYCNLAALLGRATKETTQLTLTRVLSSNYLKTTGCLKRRAEPPLKLVGGSIITARKKVNDRIGKRSCFMVHSTHLASASNIPQYCALLAEAQPASWLDFITGKFSQKRRQMRCFSSHLFTVLCSRVPPPLMVE